MKMGSRQAWLAGLLCVGLAAAGCGASPGPRTEVSVIGQAASATALAGSARITETIRGSLGGQASGSSVTVADTDFGVPVSVTLPPPAEVETVQQLQHALTQETQPSTSSGIVTHISIANKAGC